MPKKKASAKQKPENSGSGHLGLEDFGLRVKDDEFVPVLPQLVVLAGHLRFLQSNRGGAHIFHRKKSTAEY